MDLEPGDFLMGDRHGAHLLLRPLHADRDGNCLITDVRISAGGFSGRLRTFPRAEELSRFRDGLATLYDRLSGEAVLAPMDGALRVAVVGDGRGGLVARGEATDDPAIGNRLHFVVLLDQTYLPGMIAGLDEALGRFAVAG